MAVAEALLVAAMVFLVDQEAAVGLLSLRVLELPDKDILVLRVQRMALLIQMVALVAVLVELVLRQTQMLLVLAGE